QEHGDLINLHDWYQSFKSTIGGSSSKRKHRMQQSPKSKRRKATHEPVEVDEASIEYPLMVAQLIHNWRHASRCKIGGDLSYAHL
ncbi:Origin recognition complex subunit 3, partial [Asimina triloba]